MTEAAAGAVLYNVEVHEKGRLKVVADDKLRLLVDDGSGTIVSRDLGDFGALRPITLYIHLADGSKIVLSELCPARGMVIDCGYVNANVRVPVRLLHQDL